MSANINTAEPPNLVQLSTRLVEVHRDQPWRSLEELAGAPEFRELLAREFPSQLAEWDDPVGRRNFLKLMAASLALAGVTGCTQAPPEKIVPYVRAPEDLVPGRPLSYATALTRGGFALGVLVESHMGRPTKIEGNPLHPVSLGATDAFAQAAILGLYDPDRSQTVRQRGTIDTWDHFLTAMGVEIAAIQGRRGAGLRILTETTTSPTLAAQLQALLEALPEARWHLYEPAGYDNVRAGSQLAFGKYVRTLYRFTAGNVILSLDADFLHAMHGSVRYARRFSERRHALDPMHSMNRLFVAESTPTITGAAADHRLPLRPGSVEILARAVAGRLGVPVREMPTLPPDMPEEWLTAVVQDLLAHRGSSLVMTGPGQPPVVHALAHAINRQLFNVGETIEYVEPVEGRSINQFASLTELVDDMRAGRVETLVVLGGNPVYTAPGSLDFTGALEKVKLRIHLSEYNDETSFLCNWHVPAAHELESWSDARSFDGAATILQPLIAPLYGGKTAHELVSVLAGKPGRTSYEIVQEHWRGALGEQDFDRTWRRALHDGVVAGTEAPPADTELKFSDLDSPSAAVEPPDPRVPGPPQGGLDVEFRTDPTVWDGRYANNGWLQELPKPLTKITWDHVAMLSPATAKRLAMASEDVIQVSLSGRTIEAPVWIMPGQVDDCISLTFGGGRTRSGRVGTGVGYNAYAIRPAHDAWFAQGGSVTKTGRQHKLATTQSHHSMEGRDIVRVTTLARQQEDPQHMRHVGHGHHDEPVPNFYPMHESPVNAWGMVVDQTACIGCNACVVACQAENNIPVVGKDQVAVGREMHWLRIDRYYDGLPTNPSTHFQPMMCLHCEQAPCEVVCPVAATVHDAEGTSNMVYNRCVGTRYCSNNCPYKVRRFNYLQYSDETTPSLKLMRNPDVTVRSRGVMEKCSYCIQRINVARIDAKKENREIRDGEVVTACQQACPTRAIVFGNLNDTQAAVLALKASPLNYSVLGELNTRPRTTYLAQIINPHPDLPVPEIANRHGHGHATPHPPTEFAE